MISSCYQRLSFGFGGGCSDWKVHCAEYPLDARMDSSTRDLGFLCEMNIPVGQTKGIRFDAICNTREGLPCSSR
jgi:hypothetical protein